MHEEQNKAMKDEKQKHEGIMEKAKTKLFDLQSDLKNSTRNLESCNANIKVSSNLCLFIEFSTLRILTQPRFVCRRNRRSR
jgi:hypothetical protein